jgi:hypothetical protein
MTKNTISVIYVVVLVIAIVSVDVLFLKHRFWERLAVNVAIVLLLAAFYLVFLKKP